MKKNLLLLTVCLSVLIGLVLFKNKLAQESGSVKPAYAAELFDRVFQIKISGAGEAVTLVKKGQEWTVLPLGFMADTAKINEILPALRGLLASDIVSRNPQRLGEYGLDSLTARNVILLDNNMQELANLYIGKHSTIDFNSTFWKQKGNDDVFRTPGSFSYSFAGNSDRWYIRKLYAFEKTDINQLQVAWKDSTGKMQKFTLTSRGNDDWDMIEPKLGKVRPGKVNVMAARFNTITVDNFLPPDSSVAIGDTLDLYIKATLNSGKIHEIKSRKIETEYYLAHPTQPVQIKLEGWRLNVFNEYPDSLWSPPDSLVATDSSTKKTGK